MRRYASTSLCACLPFLHRNDAPDVPPAPPLNSSVSVPVLTLTAASSSKSTAEPSHPLSTTTASTSPTSTLPRTSVQSLLLAGACGPTGLAACGCLHSELLSCGKLSMARTFGGKRVTVDTTTVTSVASQRSWRATCKTTTLAKRCSKWII